MTDMPAAPLSLPQLPLGRRIVLIGCGGSGKTYLANQLGKLLDVAVTHLDGHYYNAEWNRKPDVEFAALQHRLVADDRWIIEGNYASTMSIRLRRADTVIFLDIPPLACLAGLLQRRWCYGAGQHTEVGVYNRITWKFIRYIFGYRRSMRPRVQRLIDDNAQHALVITLTSRAAVSRFLQRITADP